MMKCGLGVVRGVGGPIVYHLRAPRNIHWKKMHMGDSLISNLLSCLLEGAEGRGILKDQLWGGKCVDRVLSEPRSVSSEGEDHFGAGNCFLFLFLSLSLYYIKLNIFSLSQPCVDLTQPGNHSDTQPIIKT